MNKYLSSIPANREGWVYFLHAEGTNRYKIGRSINPVTRYQQLQKQSPYPLKIIKSFWTLDAPADELYIHQQLRSCNVFGEWFDLEGTEIKTDSHGFSFISNKFSNALLHFEMSKITSNIVFETVECLRKKLGKNSKITGYISDPIYALYCLPKNRQELEACEEFVRDVLLNILEQAYPILERDKDGILIKPKKEELLGFIRGCLRTFSLLSLKSVLDETW